MEAQRTSGGRTVGIGVDYSPSSKFAIRWVVENFARKGDQIVLIHTQSGKSDDQHVEKDLWQDGGSPLIPLEELKEPNVQSKYGIQADASILELLDTLSKTREVEVMAKVYWGDAREKLIAAVDDLNLNAIVVGSRGLGMMKSLLLGSVSNHVVNHAHCPVTVVKGFPSHRH